LTTFSNNEDLKIVPSTSKTANGLGRFMANLLIQCTFYDYPWLYRPNSAADFYLTSVLKHGPNLCSYRRLTTLNTIEHRPALRRYHLYWLVYGLLFRRHSSIESALKLRQLLKLRISLSLWGYGIVANRVRF